MRLFTPPSGRCWCLKSIRRMSFSRVGEEPGKALLVAPNVRTRRLAAAVGAFPAVDVAVGDAEHHADVADRGRLRGDAVQQPVGKRAVVEGLAERLRSAGGSPADWRPPRGSRPWRRAKASRNGSPSTSPDAVVVLAAGAVLVRIMPRQEEGHFDAAAGGHVDRRRPRPR